MTAWRSLVMGAEPRSGDSDGLIRPNTLACPNYSQTRHIYEMETSIFVIQDRNIGHYSLCISDQSAMLRLKHKRCHYTAEQVHYSWYQDGWRQTVCGLWYKATAQVAIWKINTSQAVYVCEKNQICCFWVHTESNSRHMFFSHCKLGGDNTINYKEIHRYSSSFTCAKNTQS